VRIDIKGLKEVHRFFNRLPKEMDKELSKTNESFIIDVQRTAKKIAPKDTGWLRSSIVREPVRKGKFVKKWKLVVEAPHGIHQEKGFKPHMVYIRNSAKLAPGFYFVKKNTPFMKPAVERNIQKFFNQLAISTSKSIKRAGG